MSRTHFFLWVCLILVLAGGCQRAISPEKVTETPSASQALPWYTSMEEASKQSLATGKPIMMNFTGSDWCIYCIKLKKEVFDTEMFQKWSSENVILLELDFPRHAKLDPEMARANEALAGRYQVQGFPTIVFTDHEGNSLGTAGYAEGGPEVWLKKAEASFRQP